MHSRASHLLLLGLGTWSLGPSLTGCVEIDPSYGESYGSSGGTDDGTATEVGTTVAVDTEDATEASSGSGGPADGTNIAFVTSTTHNGALGGLEGADAICNERAQAAGLPGTYVAYLSDGSTHAIDRLGSASGWVRTDGLVWARDRAALTSGLVAHPLLRTESGGLVGDDGVEVVYTATQGVGTSTPDHCAGWTDATSTLNGSGGFSDGAASFWVDSVFAGCDFAAHLYCLGIDYDDPVEIPPPAADSRLIFATTELLAADAGRDAADALCAAQASAAGRDGTFLALMAEPGETLFDRHDLTGGDWVRADGAEVLRMADGPAGWELVIAPVIQDANGELTLIIGFWTGAGSATEVATTDTTCNGWTDPAFPMRPGGVTVYADWLVGLGTATCEMPLSVVCLEQ